MILSHLFHHVPPSKIQNTEYQRVKKTNNSNPTNWNKMEQNDNGASM